MKKLLILVCAAALSAALTSAQEASGAGDAEEALTYIGVPVYRVVDTNEAYIVMYQGMSNKSGRLVLPKSWLKAAEAEEGAPASYRRLFVRPAPRSVRPYLSVFYRGETFEKVYLTVPLDKGSTVWAFDPGMKVDSSELEKDSVTLDL